MVSVIVGARGKKNFHIGVVDRVESVGDSDSDCSACENILPHLTKCGQINADHQGGEAVQGAWYPLRKGRKGTQDEVHRRKK